MTWLKGGGVIGAQKQCALAPTGGGTNSWMTWLTGGGPAAHGARCIASGGGVGGGLGPSATKAAFGGSTTPAGLGGGPDGGFGTVGTFAIFAGGGATGGIGTLLFVEGGFVEGGIGFGFNGARSSAEVSDAAGSVEAAWGRLRCSRLLILDTVAKA